MQVTRAVVKTLFGVCRIIAFAMFALAPVLARAGMLTFAGTSEYSTGRYGDTQATDEYYEAVSGSYEFGRTFLKLTVPYLYVVGPANVVPDFGFVTNRAGVQRQGRGGLGDIVASVDEEISPDSWDDTDIDLIGKVKFGTASFSRGLGTGEDDYYAQLEWTQRYGSAGIETVIDGGRRFVESSAETGLHDIWYGSAGAIWHATKATSVSTWFDIRQSPAPFETERMESTLEVSNTFAPGWKITAYGSKGFTKSSPSVTIGLILSRAFSL
jgi:hypothetical protein